MSERYLITGCNGQLGKALREKYPKATALSRDDFDITDIDAYEKITWSKYDVIINAAAYVNADKSETSEGRSTTWHANALGVRNLSKVAIDHNLKLIHFSSEYIFDGVEQNHSEDEIFTPLSVYGQTKAAADMLVSLVPEHYILRVSWVVGDGHNFVRTMKNLADMRINPKVVNDQFGRLTFVSEIVRAVEFLLECHAESGVYNLTNSGKVRSWHEIAELVFELAGHEKHRVTPVSTDEYQADKIHFAPRPAHSDLNLSKIKSIGFESVDYDDVLSEYVNDLGVV